MTLIDDGGGQTAFVLTRRAPRLSSHGGQKALPGGRIDAGESAIQAGLRELSEEINLHLNLRNLRKSRQICGSSSFLFWLRPQAALGRDWAKSLTL